MDIFTPFDDKMQALIIKVYSLYAVIQCNIKYEGNNLEIY